LTLFSIMKYVFGSVYYYSGLFRIHNYLNYVKGNRVTIVTYHRVSDSEVSKITDSLPYLYVNSRNFQQQLDFCKKHYKMIGKDELSGGMQTLPGDGGNRLLITFDDGYMDNYTRAYPILKERGIFALIFLAASKVDQGAEGEPFWWDRAYSLFSQVEQKVKTGELDISEDEYRPVIEKFLADKSMFFQEWNLLDDAEILACLEKFAESHPFVENREDSRMLSWEQLREMKSNFAMGSHTFHHRNLLECTPDEVDMELEMSKRLIEQQTGEQVLYFSYPAGNHDEKLMERVNYHGYMAAVTTENGINNMRSPYSLKRINTWEGSSVSPWGTFSKGVFALHLAGLIQ